MNYNGFPKSICTSVNEIMCHGVPNSRRVLLDGDIIKIDVTVFHNGFHGDTCKTFPVGKVRPELLDLIKISERVVSETIKICGPGVPFNHIGAKIDQLCAVKNVTSCSQFAGHGIGRVFHELPQILHYTNDEVEIVGAEKMIPGMAFTIEPIIKIGSQEHEFWKDGLTIVSKDRFASVQTEHTILITDVGVECLTLQPENVARK